MTRKCAGKLLVHPNCSAQSIWVGCGKCGWCRIRHKGEWAGRLYAEHLAYGGVSAFYTHTFHEDCCPPNEGPEEFRLGMEQWRRWIHAEKTSRARHGLGPLRVFGVAELGTRTKRPHHHQIFFGDEATFVRVPDRDGRLMSNHARCPWPHGFINAVPVTDKQLNYVVEYISPDWEQIDRPIRSNGLGKAYALVEAKEWADTSPPGSSLGIPAKWAIPKFDLLKPFQTFPRGRTVYDWQRDYLISRGFEPYLHVDQHAGYDPDKGQFIPLEMLPDTTSQVEKMRRIMNARRKQIATQLMQQGLLKL